MEVFSYDTVGFQTIGKEKLSVSPNFCPAARAVLTRQGVNIRLIIRIIWYSMISLITSISPLVPSPSTNHRRFWAKKLEAQLDSSTSTDINGSSRPRSADLLSFSQTAVAGSSDRRSSADSPRSSSSSRSPSRFVRARPRPLRRLLDPVHVHHVAAHGVLSREDGTANRTDRVASVHTAMVG